jgi:hypothetical protein
MKTIFDAVRLKERTRQCGRHRPAHRPDIITAPVYGRWWCPDPNTYAHLAHLKKRTDYERTETNGRTVGTFLRTARG